MGKNQLEILQKRIEKLKIAKPKLTNQIANQSQALNIVAELLAGVIVGLVIGLFLDKIFDSKPLCLIICLIAGNIASLYAIWQRINTNKNDP